MNTHSLELEEDSSQRAEITDGDQTGLSIVGVQDFTIECWVKLESLPANNSNAYIVCKYNGSDSKWNYIFSYRTAETPLLRAHVAVGLGVPSATIAHTLTVGVWTHLALVVDVSANEAEWFVNGASIGTANFAPDISGGIVDGDPEFSIGGNADGSNFLDGKIDDVRFWKIKRTEQEINDNKCIELVGNEANLEGYWKFNNDYLDETSNNNDLTAIGAPSFSTDYPACFDPALGKVQSCIIG